VLLLFGRVFIEILQRRETGDVRQNRGTAGD
jgi:hypothetical protein